MVSSTPLQFAPIYSIIYYHASNITKEEILFTYFIQTSDYTPRDLEGHLRKGERGILNSPLNQVSTFFLWVGWG